MPVAPMDVYRIVADPTIDPAAKQQQIDMLYGVGAPAAGPDVRTATMGDERASINAALSDPSLGAPATPPQQLDVGGKFSLPIASPQTMAPPSLASLASEDPRQAIAASRIGAGGMPLVTGSDIPNLAAAKPPAVSPDTNARPPMAPEQGEQAVMPTADDRFNAGVTQLVDSALRGSQARIIRAHDQPTASVIEHAGAIPDEVKQKIADDAEKESKLALEEGEAGAKTHLDAAIGFDNQAHEARTEQATFHAQQKAMREHVEKLDVDFEQMVKDTAVKPSDWWTTKSTGEKVVSTIAALMFGLAQNPQGLEKLIDDDLANRRLERDRKVGAFKTRIDAFRSRLLSPEAAHSADQSLAARAVAAEASRLAESAASPEARLRGQQVAQHFQTLADQHAEEMAARETGTIRTNIAHLPDRVVGGGANPLTVLKQAKEAGLNSEGVLRAMTGGSYGANESPDEAERRVTFGAGEQVGYVANKSSQPEMQNMATALSGLRGTYSRILELTRSTGHTIAGPEKAALQANVASSMLKLQAMAKGEGANARLAGEMLEKLGPLTGAAALSTGTTDASARAQVQEALRLVEDQEQGLKNVLTPSPKTAPSGGHIETLGKSKKALGFEKD